MKLVKFWRIKSKLVKFYWMKLVKFYWMKLVKFYWMKLVKFNG